MTFATVTTSDVVTASTISTKSVITSAAAVTRAKMTPQVSLALCIFGGCKLERCPELTLDVPSVEETQQSWTKGFIHHLAWDEMREWSTSELSCSNQGKCKHKLNKRERSKQGRDFYFHRYIFAVVWARRIPNGVWEKCVSCEDAKARVLGILTKLLMIPRQW